MVLTPEGVTTADAERKDSENASPSGKDRSLGEMGLLKCGPPPLLVAALAPDQPHMQTHERDSPVFFFHYLP